MDPIRQALEVLTTYSSTHKNTDEIQATISSLASLLVQLYDKMYPNG